MHSNGRYMKSTIMKDKIKLYNEDCLQALKKMQDNSYLDA